jgi:AcrR family transcriptional regulator
MTGLRLKMKTRRRSQILNVAHELFQGNGYTRTSLAQIAEQADVSIGTIYTYFGSKGAIYYELTRPMLLELSAKADRVIQAPPEDPIEAMLSLFDALRLTKDWQNLNLLKGFDPSQPEQDKYLDRTQREGHELVLSKVHALLVRLRDAGRLRPELNLEDATFLLGALMKAHLALFIEAAGELPFSDSMVDMDRRVRLLFEPWTSALSGLEK